MKAIVRDKYGGANVLRLVEVPKPNLAENRVLVQVHAASVNPLDWHSMRGSPFIARLSGDGLLHPKDKRLGTDVAGIVESVGATVTGIRPGDEVFGGGVGTFAEYAIARWDRLSPKPRGVSFEEAAAVPVAGVTALQGLRDKGKLHEGQSVLVNGASGGVGHLAVQIAKYHGAEVTAVCSARNLDLVRSIGADHAIDYTRADFTRAGQQYDLIFDAVGNRSVSDYKRALKPHGVCVIAGFSGLFRLLDHVIVGSLRSSSAGRKVGLMGIAKLDPKDLQVLKDLLASGKIRPVIDRKYPLDKTADAISYQEGGHARGKVIVTVNDRGSP